MSTTTTLETVGRMNVQPVKQEKDQCFSTGGYSFPGIPTFDDPYKSRKWQLEHMAAAFRVFARKGFTEGTAGHISLRDPVQPNTFWINPFGVHFGMLKASDMVQIDEEGQVIGGNKVAVNAAGFQIHSAIHKARPDINAACHTHSVAGKAWSTFGRPLDIISQDTCTFLGIQTVHENFGGIVLDDAESQRIAKTLGEKNRVVILQNHGILTTGATVDEAAYLFTLMERSCEIQLMVEGTNLPKKLVGPKEAEYTAKVNQDPETLYIEFQPDFNYEVWKSKGELTTGM
ncbi:Class II Aldolase and Adducin N-terminal domain protein [Aspergillus parasiticus SU-1]|uniref:Class II Aldolase and Adducin N-terminal domain protein n=1 Tax=Aspergillus parasiticus (strain ATCC 56775 / NRRL 5862 / SRRC 143 / SU-1) TaxID=1403190 RepID=A0A0F0IAS4_ASPPU|nr:Class II Aldolase and Adducin N-terminal domain protein [Aspergillus parasiticus SU-1]